MDTLDIDSVHDVMLTLYEQTLKHNSDTQTYDDLTRISFGYYHLIRRYQDIDPTLDFKGMFFVFLLYCLHIISENVFQVETGKKTIHITFFLTAELSEDNVH